MRAHWMGAIAAACMISAAVWRPAHAAESYAINVILPLSGGAAFLGTGEQTTLNAIGAMVNKEGGIQGTPVRFVYHDDQSRPQTAIQLTDEVLAEKPAVLIGSTLVAICKAMAPLLRTGPVDYCLSPGVHPPAGSYQFSSSVDTHASMEVLLRYFRSRGFTRIAFMTSTDASGQDAEHAFNSVLKLPANAKEKVVERQYFNTTDVSVSAQIERIKDANPQVFVAWSTGAPIATVFRAIKQSGLDIPVVTTNGNQTVAEMEQYKAFLPKRLLFPSSLFPKHDGLYKLDPAVEAAQQKFYAVLKGAKIAADNQASAIWDPANILIDALRKNGIKSTASEIRVYLASRTNLAGINGMYNFKKVPQRGLTAEDAIVTRWDGASQTWIPVSLPNGAPLPK